jgi:hypothetical protein
MLLPVLRIRDVYPGSDFVPSRIPDPNCFHPGSRIPIKELKYFNPKKWLLSSKKYDPGCSSRIPGPDPDFLPNPDPESRGQKGTGSRFRIRNTGCYLVAGPLSLTLRRPVERGWINTVRQKVADFPHSSCTTQHYQLSHLTFHPSSIHHPGPGIRKKSPPRSILSL